jgi:hypothetical protein
MSSILSSNLIENIASYLPNKEKHNISFLGNYEYSIISPIIIYSYNEYIKYQYTYVHKNKKYIYTCKMDC